MANKGLSMRKVREVLRLHHVAGLSARAIARSLKISPVTVRRYVSRAEELGLGWPLPESLDDAQLERRLFPAPAPSCHPRPLPQWTEVHRELRGKDVTLALVWEEYKAAHPQGLQYSRFCERYSAAAGRLLDRLEYLQRFDVCERLLEGVPAHRVARLRRQGERHFADGLREAADNRRLAILPVCVCCRMAGASRRHRGR